MHYYKAIPIGGRIMQWYLSDQPLIHTVWARKSLYFSILTAILHVKLC